MIAGALALVILALKVSGLTQMGGSDYYQVSAQFDNIGDLKVRAPVRLAGVTIGQVSAINLDSKTFRANVTMLINDKDDYLPTDTSASILTAGLLGSNYIGLTPGYENTVLKSGGVIQITHPAIVLENLIGQLIFSQSNKDKKEDK